MGAVSAFMTGISRLPTGLVRFGDLVVMMVNSQLNLVFIRLLSDVKCLFVI